VTHVTRARTAFALALAGVACEPSLGESDAIVTDARVLAVVADPAETKPGVAVTFRALVASPEGTVASPALDWGFCTAPKPLTTDNIVSSVCLGDGAIVPAGFGATVTAMTPSNGCVLFGPDPPPGGARPRDPDTTGGYYQPMRVDLAGAGVTFALARITCDLAGASAATATAFAQAYVPNANPTLLPAAASIAGAPAALAAIPAGTRVAIEASWPSTSAETYAYFDSATDAVTFKREAMTVAWYATSGAFDAESTGRAEDDPATSTTNTWTAPSAAGSTHLWLVLRDSRGGVDFAAYDVAIVASHP
jgi:hypothetical protein